MLPKERLLVVILLFLFALQSLGAIKTNSPTWDETNYFGLGYYLLKRASWDVPAATLHPPLSYYLNSIPYLWYDADEKAWNLPPNLKGTDSSNLSIPVSGLKLLTDSSYPKDRLLILARLPMLFLGLLLGYYLWRWTRELYGGRCAMLALFLFSFCPNMLAHSGLITPDISLTSFTFISLYCLWRVLRRKGCWGWIIACSLSLGCALLSKYTALLQLPVFFIVVLGVLYSAEKVSLPPHFPFSRWFQREGDLYKMVRLKSVLVVIVLLAFLVLSLGYRFQLEPYFRGVTHQLFHAKGGHPAFLLGMYSSSGWWYYYFIAFVLKTPLPLFILLLLSFIARRESTDSMLVDKAFILIPVLVYFLFFTVNLQCIGLRYILPIYPFLFMQAGTAAAIKPLSNRVWKGIIVSLLCCWYLKSALGIYPHYLAYFNESAGGPDNGYRYLVDSNLDWGQDLKGLGKYLEEKGIDRIHLSYFGTADPAYYGIQYDWMPSYYLPEDYRGRNAGIHSFSIPTSGMVAISATNLQSVYFSDTRFYDWLKKYEPIDKIGYSIFIYDLDRPQ